MTPRPGRPPPSQNRDGTGSGWGGRPRQPRQSRRSRQPLPRVAILLFSLAQFRVHRPGDRLAHTIRHAMPNAFTVHRTRRQDFLEASNEASNGRVSFADAPSSRLGRTHPVLIAFAASSRLSCVTRNPSARLARLATLARLARRASARPACSSRMAREWLVPAWYDSLLTLAAFSVRIRTLGLPARDSSKLRPDPAASDTHAEAIRPGASQRWRAGECRDATSSRYHFTTRETCSGGDPARRHNG
jgi:hypothetical protein